MVRECVKDEWKCLLLLYIIISLFCLSKCKTNVVTIFCHIFLSNYWRQESDIWSQASYRYAILWEAFLDPSDYYFLFADFVDFYTYMKLVTKYQISVVNSCWGKCDEKWTYMFNEYTNQQSPQTGSRSLEIFRHIFQSNYWRQESDIWSQTSYRYAILWEAFLDPSDSYFLFADFVDITFLSSIVAEKNTTKNEHICSMCIKTN
jgi:hypothetical protein